MLLFTSLLLCLTASADSLGTFEGILVEPDGKPVVAANVVFLGPRRGALSDDEGRFRVRDVPPGRWIVRYQMIGFSAVEDTIDFVAGRTVRCRRVLTQDRAPMKEMCPCSHQVYKPRPFDEDLVEPI
jgi:iron complex outermembrane receptor protein